MIFSYAILAKMPSIRRPRLRLPYRLISPILVAALTLLTPPSQILADQIDAGYKTLKVALSTGAFPNVDQREAQAAMQLWTKELARGMGIKAEPKTVIYARTEDLLDAVNKGELSVVSLPALEYLRIRKAARMTPSLVSAGNNGNKYRYVLVTRRDSGIKTIRDLRGRSVLLAAQKMQSVGNTWLSVLLLREGIRDQGKFFSEVKESVSPSKALMNVFFRKNDAVIISHGALETSTVLNPQLSSQLTVLAESSSFLGTITCIPYNVSQNLKRSIENTAMHLHESRIGKQMFTLFQMERAVPFRPSHLEGLEELLRERDRLKAKPENKR